MNKTFLSLLLPLALLAGEPQKSIRGIVLDPTGRPVEGARIECAGRKVFTGPEGRFALGEGDACDAGIEKSGFETASMHLRSGDENRVTLTINGPVESVIVTATRSQATPEQSAVAANVFLSSQIEARNFAPVEDLLREVPGIAIVSAGRRGSDTSIFTRGAAYTGTLVLLDGVPLNDPGGQINLAHLSSFDLDRVEVVRGPESAIFGAEAAAGAVQLFSKHGDPEKVVPHGIFSYERGNFQTDRWQAGLNGGYGGKLDYALHADELHSAGAFQDDYYRNNSGSANLGYRISDATQLRGVLRMYDAHVGTPGQVAYQAFDLPSNEETRQTTVSLRADDSRGSRYFQTFSYGYNRLRDRFNDNEPYSSENLAGLVRDVGSGTYFVSLLNPAALPAAGQLPPGTRIANATAYFGPYGSLNLTERQTADYQGTLAQSGGALVFGYDFQQQSGNVSGTNASRDHHGFFVNEQYSFGGRIYLSGGARVEHSTAFGTEFVPRGGVSFKLLGEHGAASSTFLRFSAGRGISEPSLYDNYVISPFAMGNRALKPEKTNSYEAGLVQEWFGRRVRTEVAAFRSSFRDLITYVYPTFENIGTSWARGLEFSAQTRLARYVSVAGNYTRLYSRITSSTSAAGSLTALGQELSRRPGNSGSLVLSITPRRWTFIVGGRMVGERHDSDYLGFGVTRNPGYQNVYASASYTFAKHFMPTLRIDNLLNERYEEALGYTALSRSIIGGLRIVF